MNYPVKLFSSRQIIGEIKIMKKTHTFHIPVMGIGFTIDTPLKLSHLGIDSVISLVDDILIEKVRKIYCDKNKLPYEAITEKTEDFRAKRITSYLNLINQLVEKKFEELKGSAIEKGNEIREYFNLLPDSSQLKNEFKNLTSKYFNIDELRSWLKANLSMGSIDVNIMTKVDTAKYKNGEKLPVEFNDAHSALRGFANSDLKSSLVLSAGMNPRLYSYLEQFDDFYPDEKGVLKKKIVLKVSDFRSALIQGKFLAKKGIWVSEFRIESGLNCGGHAFATDGFLMGPILAEFKNKRNELLETMHENFLPALISRSKAVPSKNLDVKITAQGGVGTAEEHDFLLEHYNLDSIGWGTPFLLVDEATTVDDETRRKLIEAGESDLYLSNISPLGVPFNSLKGNSKDIEKMELVEKGRPGSSCPKKFITFNSEFTKMPICSASRQYQHLKIKELNEKELSADKYKNQFEKITDKACICTGLGTSVLIENNLDTRIDGKGVSVCPGPNMAYFSKSFSLKEMIDHIYGRINIASSDRPNVFIKELKLYINYLKNKISDSLEDETEPNTKYFLTFVSNLKDGVNYYLNLFNELKDSFEDKRNSIIQEFERSLATLEALIDEINCLALEKAN